MFIESVPNRKSPPAILLRETFRQNGKVKHRTIANLSSWDPRIVAGLKNTLNEIKGDSKKIAGCFQIVRSLPHGHVKAVRIAMKRLGIDKLLHSRTSPERDLASLLIAARLIQPTSKLSTLRSLEPGSASHTLLNECGIEQVPDEHDLYKAMDWLLERQSSIQKKLAKRHLKENSLILYDLSSSYFEGECCPLAKRGYSRDGVQGKLQIVYGLLCDKRGCPIAVKVFEGNTADPTTLQAQIETLQKDFSLKNIVLVGDRGMITQARINEELRGVDGLDWISALPSQQIRKLVNENPIHPELFDDLNIAEIQSPDFPGERLIVCRNHQLAKRRAHKREELLESTERLLEEIKQATVRSRAPLRGKDKIGLRVGKLVNRYKVAKHFQIEIEDDRFSWQRNEQAIAQEKALDGIYVIRTSVPKERLSDKETVERYKDLSLVENAFRSLKSVDLKVRPIYHYLEGRVRSHVFLCMLAYYVEWHMRGALKDLLYDEEDRGDREDPVRKREASQVAKSKKTNRKNEEGLPVNRFQDLLRHLSSLTLNTIAPDVKGAKTWNETSIETPLQAAAFERLEKIAIEEAL